MDSLAVVLPMIVVVVVVVVFVFVFVYVYVYLVALVELFLRWNSSLGGLSWLFVTFMRVKCVRDSA